MNREERKVVTVLFTDLVGFTGRAEELDPEDVRAMLSPYYARLREQIEQRGGTVEKFIGDAVMAVFGAPVAHEDDPVRAVLTALAIRDAVKESSPDLQIRTAVNTGEALVALDANPSAGEAIASGDVVNTTARLQTAAPTDGILVGEATYRATRHVIEYQEAEPVDAKGKAKPIPVWEVVAARSRLGVDVEQTRRSPLVGREREIATLTDAFTRTRNEGTAQLVTLVGVPGIGKSRLVAELLRILDEDPDVYWWRQGRSLPYGESQSYWALGEIVKAQAGILETDDANEAEAKLTAMLAELVSDDGDRRWIGSHLAALAGVATDVDESGDRRSEAFSAWTRFVEALAEQRPLVLVFEDLHWADDGLLDFVDHLADWVSGVPVLLVGTARPELLERRPGWGGGKRNATTLSIGALSNDDTAKLLQHLLERAVLDADTQQLVLKRAEGNPLYAGEYARMLADNPAEDLPVPETVQGLIAARIDQLAAAEKELVQDAAVLGKVFWPGAVGDPEEQLLHALVRKEFVRRDRRSAVAGETQYAFMHLLVRDVAYGQLPRARRAEKHRAAAEWLESLAPDRSEDRAEMRAHHYREALALAAAAGLDTDELRGPARAALAEASERAAALSSWAAAEELARAALELTDGDDPVLELRVARATGVAGRPDLELAQKTRDTFLAQGSIAQAADAEALVSWMHWWRGEGEAAMAAANHSLELARDLPPSIAKARATAQVARREAIGGDPSRGIVLGYEALELAEALEHDELISAALNSLGIAMTIEGDLEGLKHLERSIEVADRSKVPDEMAKSRNNLATRLWIFGRLEEANVLWLEADAIARRYGTGSSMLWSQMELTAMALTQGDFATAIARGDELIAATTDREQVHNAARILRAAALGVLGCLDEALTESEEGLVRAREVTDAQQMGPALVTRALVLFLAGSREEASVVMDEVPEMMRSLMLELYPLIFEELGRGRDYAEAVASGRGTSPWFDAGVALVEGRLAEAVAIYESIGTPFVAAWARLLMAERGDVSQLEPARAYFESQQALPFLHRCDAVLSASA
ncbi:MAG TPA: AAA family ATPase [Gaiellaceae bacterium]|nr:AAA family ATPase [Gaiellaceae bacterium]